MTDGWTVRAGEPERLLWDSVFYTWQGAAPMKPHQYGGLNKTDTTTPANVDEEKSHKAPPLDEELQVINGCWERESQFIRDKAPERQVV